MIIFSYILTLIFGFAIGLIVSKSMYEERISDGLPIVIDDAIYVAYELELYDTTQTETDPAQKEWKV